MNIPDYIDSGILESYALGAVSDQERREVQCLSAIYPEIRQELDKLTQALENYALLHSTEPPADLQARIRSRLTMGPPAPSESTNTDTTSGAKVVPLHREVPTFQVAWVAAAAVGLVLIAFAYFLINQLKNKQEYADELAQTNTRIQTEVSQLKQQQAHNSQLISLLKTPGVETIRLAKAKPDGAQADLVVYWNRAAKQVTLEVESLPTLPADKQYQLWALVGGKPVDAGVFGTDRQRLQRTARAIAAADAFAVTIEKAGGSPTPTLSTLLAMGKVS
ncbi:anti-sigma factor [Fibrella sp. HMF5335]|uniref:Regulator of SigK n=1 Tax=Fibrella rubiginis TaxID=2817060 RepID=A0A939K427_9BACT|nr:anti-sigma factor [Fibrella rubiginis]MBO0936248.1 anti-sigma factor [Fibrella rubiginis]